MMKNFLSVFIALFVLFVTQSQVFAATSQIDESQKTMAQYNYTINTETILNEQTEIPYEILENKTNKNMNEYIWIASIFIAGLGQILMGDVEGGIWWMIKVYALPIIFFILMTVIFVSAATVGSAGFDTAIALVGSIGSTIMVISQLLFTSPIFQTICIVIGFISLIFYIMNIIDAYNMSKREINLIELEENFVKI